MQDIWRQVRQTVRRWDIDLNMRPNEESKVVFTCCVIFRLVHLFSLHPKQRTTGRCFSSTVLVSLWQNIETSPGEVVHDFLHWCKTSLNVSKAKDVISDFQKADWRPRSSNLKRSNGALTLKYLGTVTNNKLQQFETVLPHQQNQVDFVLSCSFECILVLVCFLVLGICPLITKTVWTK